MVIAPERELEIFERAFEEEYPCIGQNRFPVEVNQQDKDLLPYFREMGLAVKLRGMSRIERIRRSDPTEVVINVLALVGTAHFIHGGNLDTFLQSLGR